MTRLFLLPMLLTLAVWIGATAVILWSLGEPWPPPSSAIVAGWLIGWACRSLWP